MPIGQLSFLKICKGNECVQIFNRAKIWPKRQLAEGSSQCMERTNFGGRCELVKLPRGHVQTARDEDVPWLDVDRPIVLGIDGVGVGDEDEGVNALAVALREMCSCCEIQFNHTDSLPPLPKKESKFPRPS